MMIFRILRPKPSDNPTTCPIPILNQYPLYILSPYMIKNPQMQKSLRFKDINEYYNHMCELQLQAARAALSPQDFAKIFSIPRHYNSTIKRPRNYKPFCDKQRDECFPPIPSAFAPLNGNNDKKSKKSSEDVFFYPYYFYSPVTIGTKAQYFLCR